MTARLLSVRAIRIVLLAACAPALLAWAASASAQQDDPGGRWEFFLEQRRSPGVLAWGARLQVARESVLRRVVPRLPPGAAGDGAAEAWESLGPEMIESYVIATGRVSAVTLHPANMDVIFAGGAQGGVWRTDDGGASWRALTDQECSLAMGAVAVDPVNPDIVYAGTGEQHFSADSYYGCGVLRSSDGGETWTRLGESAFGGATGGTTVSRIVIDSATAGTLDATRLYAASQRGLFVSTDSGIGWTEVLDGIVTDVLVHGGNREVLFAAVSEGKEKTGHSVLHRSTDGGMSWRELDPGLGTLPWRAQFAQSLSNPDILYLSAGEDEGVVMARSSDGGGTWARVTAAGVRCGQCWYNQALAVHPTDPDIVYFGAVTLYRSLDGGASFSPIGRQDIHVDQHVLTVDASEPDLLLAGNDGGVYRSRDRGDSWESLNTNLSLTQFYAGVSIHPSARRVSVLGGTQDNGVVESRGGAVWPQVLGGDGGFTAIHPRLDRRWAEGQWRGGNGGPRRSDNGSYFRHRTNGIDLGDDALFIPPLVMDPFDPDLLYFGTERLYRTTNGGERWEPLVSVSEGRISAIAPSRSDARVVYFGTSQSHVMVTRDGGESWMSVSGSLPSRYVTDIAVHPHEPGTAYAAFSGFGTSHVFVTRDHGASWSDLTGDLPDHPVNAVLLDPSELSRIYIGTDLGVFMSRGDGSWVRFGEGLPMAAVYDLAVEPAAGVMVAATHGRGAFSIPMRGPPVVELRRAEARAEVAEGGSAAEGAAPVRIYGTGWPEARWSASGAGAAWLELTRAEGASLDSVQWRMDPGELEAGEYVDTVVVVVVGGGGAAAAGAWLGGADGGGGVAGWSAVLPLRMTVRAVHALALPEAGSYTEVPAGSREDVPDSVEVAIAGPAGADVAWRASHGGSEWLNLVDSAGKGPGRIRWRRAVEGLAPGLYVDTIRVRGEDRFVVGAALVDSLRVAAATTVAVAGRGGAAAALVGVSEPLVDTLVVVVAGYGARTAGWTAVHGGAAWLELVGARGSSGSHLVLHRRAGELEAGAYVDTIRIQVEGGDAPQAVVVDSLLLGEDVTAAGAASAVFGEFGLGAVQARSLDRLGNRDGSYDLGDMLAWVARCRRGGARCGGAGGTDGGAGVDGGSGAAAEAGATLCSRGWGGRMRRRDGRGCAAAAGYGPVAGAFGVGAGADVTSRTLGGSAMVVRTATVVESRAAAGGSGAGAEAGGVVALRSRGWGGRMRRRAGRGCAAAGAGRGRHRRGNRLRRRRRWGIRLRRRYRAWSGLALLVAGAVAGGCGGDDVVEPPVATTATVVPAEVTLSALQETTRLVAAVYDQNGQVMQGAPVAWSSSDVSVATVDATGTAVAVGNGRAQIAAASGNALAAASVTVAQVGVGVEVGWGEPRLLLGDSVRVTLPVANDRNGHRIAPSRIAWSSSDPAVATVDADGWVRTLAAGQVRISVDVGGFAAAQDYSVELDPGFLRVELTLPPGARDIGALLSIEGPVIDSLRAPGIELYRSRAASPTQIIVAGPLSSGPVLEFWVPHRGFRAQYPVQLLQVVGEDYARKDLTGYAAAISR